MHLATRILLGYCTGRHGASTASRVVTALAGQHRAVLRDGSSIKYNTSLLCSSIDWRAIHAGLPTPSPPPARVADTASSGRRLRRRPYGAHPSGKSTLASGARPPPYCMHVLILRVLYWAQLLNGPV